MPTLQDYSDTRLHLFDGLDAEEVEAVADGAGGVVTEEQAGVFEWFGIGFENGTVGVESAEGLGEIEEVVGQQVRAQITDDGFDDFAVTQEQLGQGQLVGSG